jgi:hypothetical protein
MESVRQQLLQDALDLEPVDARWAMRLFTRLEREGNEIRWPALLIGVSCVLVASTVGFLVVRHLDSYETPVSLAFLMVGLAPLLVLWVRRDMQRRGMQLNWRTTTLWAIPVSLAMGVSDLIKALSVALFVLLVLVPVSFALRAVSFVALSEPWSTDDLLAMPWFVGFGYALLVYVTLAFLADVSSFRVLLFPWNALPEVLIGLRERRNDVLGFAAFLATGALLAGGGALGLLYEDYWLALAAAAVTAVLLGLGYSSFSEPDEQLSTLTRLGQIRCRLRAGNTAAARWHLNQLYQDADSILSSRHFAKADDRRSTEWVRPAIDVLGGAVYDFQQGRKPGLGVLSAQGWENVDWRLMLWDDIWSARIGALMGPNRQQWLASVGNTRQLHLMSGWSRWSRRSPKRRTSGSYEERFWRFYDHAVAETAGLKDPRDADDCLQYLTPRRHGPEYLATDWRSAEINDVWRGGTGDFAGRIAVLRTMWAEVDRDSDAAPVVCTLGALLLEVGALGPPYDEPHAGDRDPTATLWSPGAERLYALIVLAAVSAQAAHPSAVKWRSAARGALETVSYGPSVFPPLVRELAIRVRLISA